MRGFGRLTVVAVVAATACGDGKTNPFDDGGGTSTGGGSVTASPSESGLATTSDASSSGFNETDQPKLDLPIPDLVDPFDPPDPSCEVEDEDDIDAVGDCGIVAPPDSFEPDVQWQWNGASSAVTPLVANLTDDNDDGEINLCDTPDVVVVSGGITGTIVVLDGGDGHEQFDFGPVHAFVTPAIGDIDGDGDPEIVSARGPIFGAMRFVAFDTDGTELWVTDQIWQQDQGGAVAIADMDNDGSPEIIGDGHILDASGNVLFSAPAQMGWGIAQRNTATAVADLDGDGDQEMILGQAAYHHDGTEVWNDTTIQPGYPQVANLDNDDDPEIIVNNNGGITILEHDGAKKYSDMRPTGDAGLGAWFRPSTVHDFDGDEIAEFAVSSAAHYSVFERNLTATWSADVVDSSGWAAGTAFDFLGDGVAEAIYADEVSLLVFGDAGSVELQVPRSSKTLIEYPVVADVDNDGSAEIVIVSSEDWDGNQTSPTVQVIRDVKERWIQARRIWNQHTYHVTNVREDGTIPAFEQPSWLRLNTYRTNAQIENGEVCQPDPEG